MAQLRSMTTVTALLVTAGITLFGLSVLGAEVARAATSSGGLSTGSSSPKGRDGVFPVKARVSWGDGLGAGRGHQGQDLMARCGKKIVASKAGKVRFVKYQASGAGNYAVVRGTDSKFDYVYMHMIKRPRVRPGQRVKAGQTLGYVGSTGRSSACHLHFEMWSRPGWYRGGNVKNPRPFLRKWTR